MTVGKKCMAATLVSTTLMVVVAGFGYWGIRQVARSTEQTLHKEVLIAEDAYFVKIHLLALRRYEKAMVLGCRDPEKVNAYEVRFFREEEVMRERLRQIEALATRPEDRQQVVVIGRELDMYVGGMKKVIAALEAGSLKSPQEADDAVLPYKGNTFNLDDAAETLAVEAKKEAEAATADVAVKARTTLLLMTWPSVAAVLLGALLSWRIGRSIARPLAAVAALMRDIAAGEGDLTRRVQVRNRDEVGELASWFNVFVDKVHNIVAQARHAALQVASAAEQMAATTESLSGGTQEQASSLEETAASLEEITGSVNQNAENAQQANQLATASRSTAEKGGQVVSNAVTAMGEISQASRKITDIISTIDEIAFQTNLLALNAAVEAARAGEQGRGFAVVAAEVRNLAQRSAAAAKEIKTLIQDSVRRVEMGSELVGKSGQTLEEIVASVRRVTELMAEIAASSKEQSSGINQVNRAVAQMDSVVQQNAAQTEELSSASLGLADQARQLQALIGRFKLAEGAAPELAATTEPGTGARAEPDGRWSRKLLHERAVLAPNPPPQAVATKGRLGNGAAPQQGGFTEF